MEALRSLLSRYGLPEQLVSTNRPQFTCSEFIHFMWANRIKHIRSAPYHPSSNGQVERFVQTLKRSLRASEGDSRSLPHRLAEFLLNYRTTPQATTGCSPGELFLKRPLGTNFDLLRRSTRNLVEVKQAEQKQYHDRRTKLRCLFPGSPVMVTNYQGDTRWIPGAIVRKLGPVTYSVDVGNGRIVKRHVDQLRQRDVSTCTLPAQTMPESKVADNYYYPVGLNTPAPQPPPDGVQIQIPRPEEPAQRYPQRQHRPPNRYIHQ